MLASAGRLQAAPDLDADGRSPLGLGALRSRSLRVAAALLSLALALALYQRMGEHSSGTPLRHAPAASSHAGLLSLPSATQGPVSAALGAAEEAYQVRAGGPGFRAANPAQHLSARFDSSGVSISSGATRVGIGLRAIGYGSSLSTVGEVEPRARANRVLYSRGTLSEWYANGPLGIEQGFSIARAPSRRATGPLTLAMALRGNAHAELAANGRSVTFGHAGGTVLRYGGLQVTDAGGRTLHSWLELRARRLLLRVDARGARFPLRIDPFLQEAELTSSYGEKSDYFGESVAVSGDTIVVGAPQLLNGTGAAYVFTMPASGWASATETAQLTPPPEEHEEGEEFGKSVAVSGDTIVVGAPRRGIGTYPFQEVFGAAYVYVEPAAGWQSVGPSAELSASDRAVGDEFGFSVAASGGTVVVGAPNHQIDGQTRKVNYEQGAAYVFAMPAAGWAGTLTQNAELVPSDGDASFPDGGGGFGWSVAAAGETAVVGAPLHQVVKKSCPEDGGYCWGQGAAYVFAMPTSGWAGTLPQTAELIASDGAPASGMNFQGDAFGKSVAASGDTILVGAPRHEVTHPEQGAAYVFAMPTSGWANATQTAELTASNGTEYADFGGSVAVSGDAAVVGAPVQSSAFGAAYVFAMPTTGWADATETKELTASDGASADYFGSSVAVAGGTIVAGAVGHEVNTTESQGTAYVFENSVAPIEEPAPSHPSSRSETITFKPQSGSESPSSSGAGSGSPAAAPVPDAELVSTSLHASTAGALSVEVSCPTAVSSCAGTVTLHTLGVVAAAARHHGSKKPKAAPLTLATGSFTVAGGHVVTIALHLSAKGLALLKHSHTLHAGATILAHDPAGATHTSHMMVAIGLVQAKHKHSLKR